MIRKVRSFPSRRHWHRSQVFAGLVSKAGLRYAAGVQETRVVNVEEKFDKVVGRRLGVPDSFKAGMGLQALAVQMHRSLGHRWAPKGVYRFKTHEEADEWMMRMLARSQIPRS